MIAVGGTVEGMYLLGEECDVPVVATVGGRRWLWLSSVAPLTADAGSRWTMEGWTISILQLTRGNSPA